MELVKQVIAAIGGRRPERRVTTHRVARVRVTSRRPLSIRIDLTDAEKTPIDVSINPGELRVVSRAARE